MELNMKNLQELPAFVINQLTMEAELFDQNIKFLPQRIDDPLIPDYDDPTCYFLTPKGRESSFNYENINPTLFLLRYKINISFDGNNSNTEGFTLTSAKFPEVSPIYSMGNLKRAICYMVIMIHDRHYNDYTTTK